MGFLAWNTTQLIKKNNMKKTVLSGIQTTGNLHLGNYLGSINNWKTMQDDYNCFFFLADLHAITVDRPRDIVHATTIDTAATYLACGIDPNKSTIFLQSALPEHSELAWILNCITPIGWLKRMTQFKDKAGKNQDNANVGLFTYPLLMAADILLYEADLVPVGDDQKQHLELTRDVAGAINRKFNSDVLKTPEPLIQGVATRVMSLRDGTKKMSKSDDSDASRIHIMDDADSIRSKIRKAKTDSKAEITYEPDSRPEIANLINIFAALGKSSVNQVVDNYTGIGFAKFKEDLAEIIVNEFSTPRSEYLKLMKDVPYLKTILNQGALGARVKAGKTLAMIKKEFGFV